MGRVNYHGHLLAAVEEINMITVLLIPSALTKILNMELETPVVIGLV